MQLITTARAGLIALALWPSASQAGTVAYYRFETGPAGGVVTTIPDSSGNNQNGQIYAGFPTYSASVPVSPIPQSGASDNFAVAFSGADAITFSYPFPFQTLLNATVELWINPGTGPEWDFFWTTTTPGDENRFNIYWQPENGACLDYREPSSTLHHLGCTGANTVPAGQWSYVAYVKQGNAYSIYINNSLTGNTTSLASQAVDPLTPNLPTTTNWTLNARAVLNGCPGCPGSNGILDEIRISDQVLNPSQFLVSRPSPTSKDQCKDGGWMNFVDASGRPFKNAGQCAKYVN